MSDLPQPLTDEQKQIITFNKAKKTFDIAVREITQGYTQAQIDSWPEKVRQAEAVMANDTSVNTWMIDREAQNESRPREEVAQGVLNKAKVFQEAFIDAETQFKFEVE